MARLTALEKQQVLVDSANALFTRDITSQADGGSGTVVLTTTTDHNFVVGDYVIPYDVISVENEITTFNGYASTMTEFEVLAITSNTVKITLAYNAAIDITNLKIKSVFTFNNDQMEIKSKEYPFFVIECKETNRLLNASNTFIPMETEFILTVIDKIAHHTKGRNTQIKECRAFCEEKLNVILAEYRKKVISNKMNRGEFDWIDVPVSFVDVKIEY
jgi:hypothetical protein